MNNNFDIIKLKIVSTIIVDWCNNKAKKNLLFFKNSFVSSYSKFRFGTPISEMIIKSNNNKKGYWNNGIFVFYEIQYINDNLLVSLLISSKDVNEKDRLYSFLNSNNVNFSEDIITVKTWNLFTSNNKIEDISNVLDYFFFSELAKYEKEVIKWNNDNNYSIYNTDNEMIEGSLKNISTNIYERNKEARQKCIDYHGAKCKICGFDFKKIYGVEFDGKIEVHHIKPLSEIRVGYVVDPINDLIPVCPNCHFILHSKKEGVYTPAEVIDMISNQKNS